MDYHADRFTDHSLMFYKDDRLIGVMPGNIEDDQLISHGGLTFGGIISDNKMKTTLMLELFETLRIYLSSIGIKQIIYKAIPHIYHQVPAEEDLYALFLHKAKLYRRDVSSTISPATKMRLSKGRKWAIKRAAKNAVQVKRSYEFETFIAIEEQYLLDKHHKKPVHTAAEIQMLVDRFPNNIKLFATYKDETMLGGVIIYESERVAHAQYIAASDDGKEMSALDAIMDFLINDYYRDKTYFDFGISTDQDGQYLDVGLVANKESFGARTTVYDFYKIDLV
jgi:hypothetical protein